VRDMPALKDAYIYMGRFLHHAQGEYNLRTSLETSISQGFSIFSKKN
jgi:hypothetical protein